MKHILLILENETNACLLRELLQTYYHVYQYQDASSLNLPVDLYIVDGLALKQNQRQLQRRRQSAEPIFLPFLLLTSRPDVSMATDGLRYSVDEVIITPIEKTELLLRVEVLLRTRHFSTELARSNQELEEFAYIASHDLQEPLRQTKLFIELFVNHYRSQVDAQAHQFIRHITEGIIRMETLITDLLTYSRTMEGELIVEMTNLEVVLHQVLLNLSSLIEESQAVIRTDALPSLQVNPTQMGQVFQNLITNAIKFRNRQPPLIAIKAICNGPFWTISVQDNGIGIKSDYVEQIFGMFKRLHSAKTYPGTGIGLALCKKIVQRHGGHIWVKSEPGVGSIFSFTLPVALSIR
ncbi:MAG: GHKL domain-containing protein [Cyanothece sp. SIO1E1]|nr:GHKL domain-containing protein [Cyanothece sp. SIO1E1]